MPRALYELPSVRQRLAKSRSPKLTPATGLRGDGEPPRLGHGDAGDVRGEEPGGRTFPPSQHPEKEQDIAKLLAKKKKAAPGASRKPLLLFNLPSDTRQPPPTAARQEGVVSQAICPASSPHRCCAAAASSSSPSVEGVTETLSLISPGAGTGWLAVAV